MIQTPDHKAAWAPFNPRAAGMGFHVGVAPQHGIRPGPDVPMLLGPLPAKPLAFADLSALARRIHRMRGEAGIVISPAQWASWEGSDTFRVFTINQVGPFGDERYLCAVAIQDRPREALVAALERTNSFASEAA